MAQARARSHARQRRNERNHLLTLAALLHGVRRCHWHGVGLGWMTARTERGSGLFVLLWFVYNAHGGAGVQAPVNTRVDSGRRSHEGGRGRGPGDTGACLSLAYVSGCAHSVLERVLGQQRHNLVDEIVRVFLVVLPTLNDLLEYLVGRTAIRNISIGDF